MGLCVETAHEPVKRSGQIVGFLQVMEVVVGLVALERGMIRAA